MEFTLSELLVAFAFSLVFGLILGLVYQPFHLMHLHGLNTSAAYFVTDVIYMLIFGVMSYLFCLVYIEGRVRFFVIIGEAIGFFVYYYTLRRVLDVIFKPIVIILKKIYSKLLKNCRLLLYNIKNKVIWIYSGFSKKLLKVIKNEKRKNKKGYSLRGKLKGYRRGKKPEEKTQ